MKSAPFLTLLATVLSSIALPQSRPWSSWSDATNGTEFSWCIVQTKDPISTWKIRNNNSEPISGILLVQYSTPSGALEWSGRFESIVPFIGPGKSSGGWSSYTVPSTKIHQIKWLSLHIGKRIVIESPEETASRTVREKLEKDNIERQKLVDAERQKALEAKAQREKEEAEQQRKALADSEAAKKKADFDKQEEVKRTAREDAQRKRQQEVDEWNQKEQKRVEEARRAIIAQTQSQIEANNKLVRDLGNSIMAGVQARQEKAVAAESYKDALKRIETIYAVRPTSVKSMALQALAKRFAIEAALAAYEESVGNIEMRAASSSANTAATSGVAALVSLLVEADGENRTRSAVSKLEKYEGLLQSSLQEDAERGTAVAASALEKLGFEKTIGTKRLTYSTMEQLPGLYDLKGTIQSVTVRLGTKLNVPKAKNPQKPSVKELDVTYLRDEYNAQWEAPNTTSFNLLERDSSPATGWVENIKSGTSSISTLSAPLELFERMANAKSTKDREKIPQLQTPSAEQTPFKARELSQHFRVNLELPDGHQWQQEAPMLGDLIRVLKLDLGPVGKVSVFNLDERLEGPLSKTQFLTTEVLGFGKLMGLAGCDEDVAVVRYSIDSEPADPIYSTSDDGQLVPVWKYLLKYATSGTAVVGCKSGFTYFQEFKSADQAVTFSVTSKEPSQSKLTEIRTDKERSLWMDWHEQQYGSESLVKVVGTEVAIDRYRAMQKAVPGSEIDWLIRSGFLSHLVHLDQAERSKLEVALTTIALDLANRGHLASATSLIMPTILDGSISLLYHSDPDKQTTRDRLLRDILETQYSRLSYNNLASWQTADSTLPEDCRVWNFIAAKRYNEIYSSAAQLRANFSSSDKDRIENATRFFYEFANDPNAFGPVYRVLSHRTKETYDTLDSNDISKALVVHSDSIGKMSERDEALRIVMDVLLERADLPADEVVQLLNLALIKTSLPSEFRISLIRKGLASYGSSEQMVNLARTELREQSKADLQYLLLEELINIQPTQSEAELALTLAAQKRDKSVSLKAANCLLSMSDDTATLTKVAGALKASCKPTELYGMISTFVGEDSSVENLMVLTELAIEAKSLTQAASIITTLKAKGADVAKLQLKYDAASPEKKKTSASQTSENKASNKSGKGGG